MNRPTRFPSLPILSGVLVILLAVALLAATTIPAQALPEYSAQTGEPCASCHVSPSGGGPRAPRGQAWVGGGKPGAVPDLAAALEQLGVHLENDPTQYLAPMQAPPAAQPLQTNPANARRLHQHLQSYDGN